MTYPWKNKYPSTTQVLSPHIDFSMVPPSVMEIATARGSMVHDLCARHAQGEWIVPSLIREDCKGYFDSFLQWFDLVETVHLVEEELIDENTPDETVIGQTDNQVEDQVLKQDDDQVDTNHDNE